MGCTVAHQREGSGLGHGQQLLATAVGSIAHHNVTDLQQQMGKAFPHVLGADAHPGQSARQQVVGTVQAPGVRLLGAAGEMGGIDQQDAL